MNPQGHYSPPQLVAIKSYPNKKFVDLNITGAIVTTGGGKMDAGNW